MVLAGAIRRLEMPFSLNFSWCIWMCVGSLPPKSAMFSLYAMLIASWGPFDGALALPVKMIPCSILVGLFAGPGYSAAIHLSSAFLPIKVSTTATGIVLSGGKTVVYCCTGSVYAPYAATAATL